MKTCTRCDEGSTVIVNDERLCNVHALDVFQRFAADAEGEGVRIDIHGPRVFTIEINNRDVAPTSLFGLGACEHDHTQRAKWESNPPRENDACVVLNGARLCIWHFERELANYRRAMLGDAS